jgi:hypothetical protein
MVNAVLRIWYEMMNPNVAEAVIAEIMATFYADDGRIAGTDPVKIQESLDLMTALFERVGLNMSVVKTKTMISCGKYQYHKISDIAYKRRMTGQGESHRSRKMRKVSCPECNEIVSDQYLPIHLHHQHNIVMEQETPETNEGGNSYSVSMPRYKMDIECPVPGCYGGGKDRNSLRRHFMFRHPLECIKIEEEGALPRCSKCGMHVPPARMVRHQASKICNQGEGQQRKRGEDGRRGTAEEVQFHINGEEIENVDIFKYLGRWLSKDDNDLTAVRANIEKAHAQWSKFSRILSQEGAKPKTMGIFYRTIVQAVLLFGSETWALTQRQEGLVRSFHNQCARNITRRWNYEKEDGTWHIYRMEQTLKLAGLQPVEEYIARRKRTILPYAQGRAIFRKCKRTSRTPSNSHKVTWWT